MAKTKKAAKSIEAPAVQKPEESAPIVTTYVLEHHQYVDNNARVVTQDVAVVGTIPEGHSEFMGLRKMLANTPLGQLTAESTFAIEASTVQEAFENFEASWTSVEPEKKAEFAEAVKQKLQEARTKMGANRKVVVPGLEVPGFAAPAGVIGSGGPAGLVFPPG